MSVDAELARARARKHRETVRAGRRAGFLLAGVQKGGTSTLNAMLARHPEIANSRPKELHYFDRERRGWDPPDYDAYHPGFRWSEAATIAGEATPNYVFWPGAMERIRAYNPEMKIILSFRDPVERAFSAWSMLMDRTDETPDFTDAITLVRPTRWPQTAAEAGAPSGAFVGRGYYAQQLTRVLELFPRDQLLLLDYHHAFADLRTTVDRMTDFLGVARFAEEPPEIHRRSQPTTLHASPPTAEDVAGLVALYAEDLDAFGRLSGLDVSAWPTAKIARGQLAAADLATRLAAKATFSPRPADAGPAVIVPDPIAAGSSDTSRGVDSS